MMLGIHLASRAVAARETAANKPPPIGAATTAISSSSAPPKAKPTAAPAKKDPKKALKGVLVKKKSKPTAPAATPGTNETKHKQDKLKPDDRTDGDEREAKRQKISTT